MHPYSSLCDCAPKLYYNDRQVLHTITIIDNFNSNKHMSSVEFMTLQMPTPVLLQVMSFDFYCDIVLWNEQIIHLDISLYQYTVQP